MVINPIVGVYIPIIRIPIKGEMAIPNIGSLDPGTYRSCDTCLIVKTLPFAECTVSNYTLLSQASNEQGKAHASIAIVPHDFFAGTRNGRKW